MSSGVIRVEPDLPDGCWNCFAGVCDGEKIRCMFNDNNETVDKCHKWQLDETFPAEVKV
jgi:hypothetical protein